MRVVVTGTRGIPDILGGVETHCQELFPRIASTDVEVTIIRRAGYPTDDLKEYRGIKLIDVDMPKKKSFEAIIHTVKAIFVARFKLKAEIVHIHAIGPAILVPLARLLGLKVVFTHHGPDYNRKKWGLIAKFMLRLGERLGCKYANEVIVISNVINESVKIKYNRTDCNIIYNGVPDPKFVKNDTYLRSLDIEPQKYIFAMGRFVPEKNYDQLIRAFLSLKITDYKLVIAGDNLFKEDYSKRLKELAIKNNVILPGYVKDDNLHTLLSNAKVFVLPSSHEGLPIALLEAMSYNLPVIVSDIPANVEIGLPNSCYFRTSDEIQLAQKLLVNMTSPFVPVRYNMEKYNWDLIANQVIDVYKKII